MTVWQCAFISSCRIRHSFKMLQAIWHGTITGGTRNGRGAMPLKMLLSPNVNWTGHKSGGELCKIFKFWSFLHSKSLNNVCKLLQLLEDKFPHMCFALWPQWGSLVSQTHWAIVPKWNYLPLTLGTLVNQLHILWCLAKTITGAVLPSYLGKGNPLSTDTEGNPATHKHGCDIINRRWRTQALHVLLGPFFHTLDSQFME